ncbi:hypothetical protein RJ640_026884 [Escallonia rubra]|uniref:Uncharacterized protein n=1 Tax=Escallonia rubra TaxID=112253 RepID=A0AA88RR94_9ASTE|nr:hypothetical protein RJ640_026884 [Escallonia rubra]
MEAVTGDGGGGCGPVRDEMRSRKFEQSEYMMYGKVDEKIDVYSYGVVLLELITGKKAIQTNQEANPESLARTLLSCGLCERPVDPSLGRAYNEDELSDFGAAMEHQDYQQASAHTKPYRILHVFEEPDHWLQMQRQRQREELFNGISSRSEIRVYKQNGSNTNGTPVVGGCATQEIGNVVTITEPPSCLTVGKVDTVVGEVTSCNASIHEVVSPNVEIRIA